MRSKHHYHQRLGAREIRKWHTEARRKRLHERWVPYSLRWKGGIFLRVMPQMMFAGLFAAAICSVLSFTGLHIALRSPILFTAFGFVVGIAISFRMTASYNRWWEGRMQWDHLSAVSRSMARTVWLHVPPSGVEELTVVGIMDEGQGIRDKRAVIMVIRGLALALKHHLRGEREWDDPEVLGFKELVDGIGEYPYNSINHPLTLSLYLSAYVEHVRTTTPIDTQVLTHLLTHVDTFTSIISACERLLRTPIPLGYQIAICRLVWFFILCVPSQMWRELRWWTVLVTVVIAYMVFALAEVGLEIENPWGEGPNDLDLDRYCNLLALDLDEIMNTIPPKKGWSKFDIGTGSASGTVSGAVTPTPATTPRNWGVLVDVGARLGADIGDVA